MSSLISKIKLRSERAKKCLEALSKKYNRKITWTLYTAKVLGHVLADNPEILLALKFTKVTYFKHMNFNVHLAYFKKHSRY